MRHATKRIAIILTSLLLGIISFYLFVGWYNIIPWTIVALLIGYLTSKRKDTIINGALFGYFLFLTYIITGYKGNMDKSSVVKFVLFLILFSLIGAIAGIIGALIGNFIRKKVVNSKDGNNSSAL